MRSGLGIMDMILSLYLSEGMIIFTIILLIASIVIFMKSKKRSVLRKTSIGLGIYCIIYLVSILLLVFMFDSSHEPPQPVMAEPENTVYTEVQDSNSENTEEEITGEFISDFVFDLPEGLTMGSYDLAIDAGGYLLLPYVYFNETDSAPNNWKSSGAITRFRTEGAVECTKEEMLEFASSFKAN